MGPHISPVYKITDTLSFEGLLEFWVLGENPGSHVSQMTREQSRLRPRAPFPTERIEGSPADPWSFFFSMHAREQSQRSARDSQQRPSRASRINPKSRQGYGKENTVYFTAFYWWRLGTGGPVPYLQDEPSPGTTTRT